MGEIPIIFLVFVLIWVAVIVCCRSFSSEDLYMTERARRREIILSQQQALRQCHLPIISGGQRGHRGRVSPNTNIRVTPIRVTTISRGGGSIAMDFYEIQIPPRPFSRPGSAGRRNDSSAAPPHHFVVDALTPPPPFSTAHLVSSPVFHPEEAPPTYEESLKGPPVGQKHTKDVEMHI